MQKEKHKIISVKEYNSKVNDYVYERLNKHDKEHLDKMPTERRKHFILGRYLMLKDGLDISKITYNENNKPLLDDVYFSISHSDQYTVFVSSNEEIGIDIEHLRKVDDDIKLSFMKKNVSDEEFLEHMTKMESYIKLNGYGLKNLNDDISDYDFKTFKEKDYIITICKRKKISI
jgi:phosphopantetheinyl transferase